MKKILGTLILVSVLATLSSCRTVYMLPKAGVDNKLTLVSCEYPYLCSSLFWKELACTANADGSLTCVNVKPSYSFK